MTKPKAAIETSRLEISPLELGALQAFFDGRNADAGLAIDAVVTDSWSIEGDSWLKMRIQQVEADSSWAPWLLRSIVRRADRRFVGTVGFHGPPGFHPLECERPGLVEFGYTVADECRREGYATEASAALMRWGRACGARNFVLSIALGNRASRRVAEKLGFAFEREYDHETRGREELFFSALS